MLAGAAEMYSLQLTGEGYVNEALSMVGSISPLFASWEVKHPLHTEPPNQTLGVANTVHSGRFVSPKITSLIRLGVNP